MRYLYALYATGTFVLLFLLLFPLFLLFSCLGTTGEKWNYYVVKGWGYLWFFLIGIRVQRIFLQKPLPGKTYIVVANHRSYLDTAMIFRTMPFRVKPLAKKEIASLPLFGFLYQRLAVLVNRRHAGSRSAGFKALQKLLRNGQSIFLFPEGGFNETNQPLSQFYDGAFRLALNTRTDLLPVIFPDTDKRFHFSSFWKWSPGRCRAIFLPPVALADTPTPDITSLKENIRKLMEAHLYLANKDESKELSQASAKDHS